MPTDKYGNRIHYLKSNFNVLDINNPTHIIGVDDNTIIVKLEDSDIEVIGLTYVISDNGKIKHNNIAISYELFNSIINVDPSNNKINTQWVLNILFRLIKSNDYTKVFQFINEELPIVTEYLLVFEQNKFKKLFKTLCESSEKLKHIQHFSDINNYKSLSELFESVTPFIFKDISDFESKLLSFVNSRQAIIPFKDSKFTVFIPLTKKASELFSNYSNWCTSKKDSNGFKNYVNQLGSDGKNSKLYVVIDNDFFTGLSSEVYQFHFESNQIKDRTNSDFDVTNKIFTNSKKIRLFFINELVYYIKQYHNNSVSVLLNNKYTQLLHKLNLYEGIFELMDVRQPYINIIDKIIRLPDNMDKFKELDQLVLVNNKITSLPDSIYNIKTLRVLVLAQNKIQSIDKKIGNLTNLVFLNLVGNPIIHIPDEISKLDRSNGGKLEWIAIDNSINSDTHNKLKDLLPTTIFNYNLNAEMV